MLPGDPLPPVLADFDKDGKLDFATGYSNSGIVDIGINAGGGRFNVQNSATGYLYLVPVGERATPMGLAVGDLNQDGWPDLAVSAGLSARGLFFSGIVTLLGPKGGNPQTRRCLLDQT